MVRAPASYSPASTPITSFMHRCACASIVTSAVGDTQTVYGCAPAGSKAGGARDMLARGACWSFEVL